MKRLLLALFACVIVAACGGGASVNSPDPIMHNAQAQVAPVGPWTYIEPINGAKPPVCDPTRDFIQVEPNGLNWCVKAFFYPVLGVSLGGAGCCSLDIMVLNDNEWVIVSNIDAGFSDASVQAAGGPQQYIATVVQPAVSAFRAQADAMTQGPSSIVSLRLLSQLK